MPYKNKEEQNAYQRNRVATKRSNFFEDKACISCGSKENLELDHINSKDKISHRIWSWSEERFKAELSKCQVLCNPCHIEKSRNEKLKGTENPSSKLRELDVLYVRELYNMGYAIKFIAREFGMNRNTIRSIIRKETWTTI